MKTCSTWKANRFEEPGAGKLHAGIREGAARQLAVLPQFFHVPSRMASSFRLRLEIVPSAMADGSS